MKYIPQSKLLYYKQCKVRRQLFFYREHNTKDAYVINCSVKVEEKPPQNEVLFWFLFMQLQMRSLIFGENSLYELNAVLKHIFIPALWNMHDSGSKLSKCLLCLKHSSSLMSIYLNLYIQPWQQCHFIYSRMNKTYFYSSQSLVKLFHPTGTSGEFAPLGCKSPLHAAQWVSLYPLAHVTGDADTGHSPSATRQEPTSNVPSCFVSSQHCQDTIRGGCCLEFQLYGNTTQPQDFDLKPYIAAVVTVNLLCNLEEVTSMPHKHIPK